MRDSNVTSSNRLWAYTGENFILPLASKICPLRKTTTVSKGTDHGLMAKMNVYTKFNIYIYISKIKLFILKKLLKKYWLKISLNTYCTGKN